MLVRTPSDRLACKLRRGGVEREQAIETIWQALLAAEGRQEQGAEGLGISRRQLIRLINEAGISDAVAAVRRHYQVPGPQYAYHSYGHQDQTQDQSAKYHKKQKGHHPP